MSSEIDRWGGILRYHKKTDGFGLYGSRLLTVRVATGDVVLFLDDDVEIHAEYLVRLLEHYDASPLISGVGGIDVLAAYPGVVKRGYDRLFMMNSGRSGRLSPSAYNGSLVHWINERAPFETEFLSGCNMSFRRSALMNLEERPWLHGYSLGEDVVLSAHARRSGRLLVDPMLSVRHHASPANRLKKRQLAYYTIVNGHQIVRTIHGGKVTAHAAAAWTACGFLLKALLRPWRAAEVLAIGRGLRDVIRGNR